MRRASKTPSLSKRRRKGPVKPSTPATARECSNLMVSQKLNLEDYTPEVEKENEPTRINGRESMRLKHKGIFKAKEVSESPEFINKK